MNIPSRRNRLVCFLHIKHTQINFIYYFMYSLVTHKSQVHTECKIYTGHYNSSLYSWHILNH